MNSPLQAPRPSWARPLVTVLVTLVMVAVAAATFVFSYDGVHAIALFGGVSTTLARYYPALFDAVLVIACVAAVVLRDGTWWARLWAWLVAIVVLAAIGTTDVLHATGYTLRHRPTETVVAAAPAVAVLLAFTLLLTMLRQSRSSANATGPAAAVQLGLPEVPGLPALPAAATGPAPVIALPPAAADSLGAGAMPQPEDQPQPDDRWGPAEPANPAREPAAAPPGELDALRAPTIEGPVLAGPVPGHDAVEDDQRDETVPDQDALAVPSHDGPDSADAAEPSLLTPPDGLPVMRRPVRGIRYAGGRLPGEAGTAPADDEPEEGEAATDYWAAEDAGQYAGLVYAAQDDEDAGRGPDQPAPPEEIDEDASPFATAPFNTVPRLNRVRSMPAPPQDEGEDE